MPVTFVSTIIHKFLHNSSGDEVVHYILLSNSHDGSIPVRVGFTPARVVCNNTLCLFHESDASKLLRVRHTDHILKNLEAIREIMNVARREFDATVEQFRVLMKKTIIRKDLHKYVRVVFALPDPARKELIPNIAHLFDHGKGRNMAGATCWGAYNAVNEYLTVSEEKHRTTPSTASGMVTAPRRTRERLMRR